MQRFASAHPLLRPWLAVFACPLAVPLAIAASESLSPPDLAPITVHAAPQHQAVPLAKEGTPQAVVHLATTAPTKRFRELSGELIEAIEATTGARLKISREFPAADQPAVILGDCEASRAAGIDAEAIPVEGFVIKTAPHRVFIVGSTKTVVHADNDGLAWGVADFLERLVGVRWYWPLAHQGRSVQKAETLVIPPLHYSDAPVFRMRVGWPPAYPNSPYGTLQVNDLYGRLRGGNSWPVQIAVHQPRAEAWARIYGETRPEIFARRDDGTRNFSMFEYTHPKLLETFLENIEFHQSLPAEQRDNRRGLESDVRERLSFIRGNAITVSPPDMGVYSASERTRERLEPERGRYGDASRLMGLFVGDLAAAVKERWPDLVVIYLPYLNYTLAPEGIEFPDNVEVQLCGMPGVAMYKQPALEALFQGNIDRWAALTQRPVQTWDYSCWPTDRTQAPFQYPNLLKAYYQRNRETIVGTFINGTPRTPEEWTTHHFTLYCWMKLLWNPEFDIAAAADAFCNRMFGAAAPQVRELLRLQIEPWEQTVWEVDTISPAAVYNDTYTKEVMTRMAELLATAEEKVAGDETAVARLAYYAQPFAAFFAAGEAFRTGGGQRVMLGQKVPAEPIIDGKLDDRWWEMAEPLVGFERHQGGTTAEARFLTEARAVWTDRGVIFGLKMHEPNPKALRMDITQRNELTLWPQNDNVEILIDVTGQRRGHYFQWLLNPAGTVLDVRDEDTTWTSQMAKWATHIGDDYWSVELFVPHQKFAGMEEFQMPHTGREWAVQLTRHRISDRPSEYSRMRNRMGGFSRNLADFGVLRFVE